MGACSRRQVVALALALHVILVDEKLRPGWAALSGLFLLGLGQAAALLIQGGRPSGRILFVVGGMVTVACPLRESE